jgi:hypothetical protein
MHSRIFLFVVSLVMAGSAAAYQGPKAEFSADMNLESSDGAMTGKVYSTRNKERREYLDGGEKTIMIIRQDKKVVWMLQPEEKMYMEMKIPKEGRKDDINGWKIEQTKVGSETVNGVSTTKSKIIMTGPKGEKLGGFWWASKEDIIVKMDAISVEKKSKERFMTELKNLKVGKQDPALFEIPSGWTKMDMGKMMMGGMKDDDDKPAPKGNKSKSGFGLKDAIDLLK